MHIVHYLCSQAEEAQTRVLLYFLKGDNRPIKTRHPGGNINVKPMSKSISNIVKSLQNVATDLVNISYNIHNLFSTVLLKAQCD